MASVCSCHPGWPANKGNRIVAKSDTVTDASINYRYKQFILDSITENIFTTQWNETQFATEIHFTPDTPFNSRGTLPIISDAQKGAGTITGNQAQLTAPASYRNRCHQSKKRCIGQ